MPYGAVSRCADGHDRKVFIRRFELLQASNVRLLLLEPCEEMTEPSADAVDVEGGDLHGGVKCQV